MIRKLEILLFASARSRAGAPSIEVAVATDATVREVTVADVRRAIVDACPELSAIAGSLLIAVDEAYAADSTVVPENATVACFPPVSGG